MASNTTLLIVVTARAVLVLAGMLAGVAYKTRTPHRNGTDTPIGDQAAQDALGLRRQQALADEYAARAQAAQVEIEIKTIRDPLKEQERSSSASARTSPQRRSQSCYRAWRSAGAELAFRGGFRRVVTRGGQECVGKREFVDGSQRQKILVHKRTAGVRRSYLSQNVDGAVDRVAGSRHVVQPGAHPRGHLSNNVVEST
jgi:hypothetical protein